MKKEVIIVPKDKCPLDVLAEMGERTKNAWIFLHKNAVEQLSDSANTFEYEGRNSYYNLHWDATEDHPETGVLFDFSTQVEWCCVIMISASDIAFVRQPADPEDIYFLKMGE